MRVLGRMGSRSQKARGAHPSHYYKVFLRKDGERWRSIAFLLENHNGPRGISWDEIKPHLTQAIKSLEVIGKRSETTFHPNLDHALVDERDDGDGWDLTAGKGNLEGAC